MSFPLFGSKDKEKKPRAKPIRKNVRAGLGFPVGRVHRHLKEREYEKRIQSKASVYVTAVLEYLCAEMFDISGRVAKDMNRKRISPRHLKLAIRNDDELNKLLANVIMPQSKVGDFKPKRKGKNAKNKQAMKSKQPKIIC